MDFLTIRTYIRPGDVEHSHELLAEIDVNGMMLTDEKTCSTAIDLLALTQSMSNDGRYFIITCTCGDPGCAGIDQGIKVIHNDENVQWLITERGCGPEEPMEFTFNRELYVQSIKDAVTQFLALYKSNSSIDIIPVIFGLNISTLQAIALNF
jgi:hypothetical protein